MAKLFKIALLIGLFATGTSAWAETTVRIHSGGPAYTDSLNQYWSADTGFSGGYTYSVTDPIASTNDPALYQSDRYDNFSYSFAVPAGQYVATLKFAEIAWKLPRQRIFDVAINGTTVLSNFDIVAQAGGPNIALDESFNVDASAGNITIQFLQGAADLPNISAIQISQGTPPSISMQPASATVIAGQAATFWVGATSSTPLSYQWRENGANIPGAIASSYTTPATSATLNSASFTVVVTNTGGSVISSAATLSVITPPSFIMQPANQVAVVGQPATFSTAATGTAPLYFQWQENGSNIAGAGGSSYTVPAPALTDNNSTFSVVVTNAAGSVTSGAATLTVNPPTYLLDANPSSLNFGGVDMYGSATQAVAFTNDGTAPVSVWNVGVSGACYFVSGVSTGLILNPGQTATLNVTFTPTATGGLPGSITVTSSATNSPGIISLSGTGGHTATLTWTPNASNVSGYNTYQSAVSGGPYAKLNSTLIQTNSYVDSTVRSGEARFYVVTSVDYNGVESAFSNEFSATIPATPTE